MPVLELDPRWTAVALERDPKRACADCGQFDLGYAVHPTVWFKAIHTVPRVHTRKRLCINCLQNRIGRPLTLDDFIPHANEWILFGYALAKEDLINMRS